MKSVTVGTVLLICLSLYVVWTILNFFGSKNRKKRQRKADRVKLNKHQKKIHKEALRLQKEGNIQGAARILESLSLTRDAVSILEKGGFIHEAAAILLRINRPNRAGTIYGRNRMWKEAAECFKKANLPEQVAVCCKLQGDLATAVVYFEEAKKFAEAAECYEELGKHRKAAKIYVALNMGDKAIEQYKHLIERSGNIDSIKLEKPEVKLIIQHLVSNSSDVALADMLVIKNQIFDVVCKLIKKDQPAKALKIYERSNANIGEALLAHEAFNKEESKNLAKIFAKTGAHEYGAIVYERIEKFERAGDLFHLNENFERAAYCYERANLSDKVTEMRIEMATHGTQKPSPPKQKEPTGSNPFKLEATGGLARESYSPPIESGEEFSPSEGDMTSVLSMAPSVNEPESNSNIPDEINSNIPDELNLNIPDESNLNIIDESNLLKDLSSEQRSLIKSIGKTHDYKAGDIILDYDQDSLGIYFILSGNIEVWKLLDHNDTKVDTMSPPHSLGKLWLIYDQPSQVKFLAGEQGASLLIIPRDELVKELDKDGELARSFYKRLSSDLVSKLLTDDNYRINLESG